MASQITHFISPEEYLRTERAASFRSEYANGEVFAMAGATELHDQLQNNISDAFPLRRLGACRKVSSNFKVYFRPDMERFCYPDLTVTCEAPEYLDDVKDVLLNPTLVVEILSPSTRDYDIGDKAFYYRRLRSLRHILLIWPDKIKVGHWARASEDKKWGYEDAQDTASSITLPELNAELSLPEIYAGVF